MAFGKKGPGKKLASKAKRTKHKEDAAQTSRNVKGIVGRVLIVVVLLAACIVPVVFVASPISYIPLVSVVLMIIISYVYLRILAKSLEYSEDSLLPSCERGSEIDFVVLFKNKSFLPFVRLEPYFYISDLFGNVDVAMPASMTLMPHEERDFSFQAAFDHIGTYSAGVQKIVISDLLGLFSHTVVNPNRHEVNVLPRIFDITKIDLADVSVQETRKAFQPIVTDDMDYAGVREYQQGDPMKTVHWNLSSRDPNYDLFTRLFETFGNPGIDIIIDHSSPEYDNESLMQVFDGLIESALSVSEHARNIGVDATIVYNDKYGERKQARVLHVEESSALINDIPRVTVGEGREAFELLQKEGGSIHGEGNVAFCTAHVTEEMITTLLDIKLHKRNPLLFLVVPSALEARERSEYLKPLHRLQTGQVTYYVISHAGELKREEM